MTWWIIYLTGSKHVKISTRQTRQSLIVWKCYDCQADESCRKELAYIIQISTGPIRTICYHIMSYATPFGEFVASERCRINVCENAA